MKRKHYHGGMSKHSSKKAIKAPKRTDPAPWLRKALAQRTKGELIDILVEIASEDRAGRVDAPAVVPIATGRDAQPRANWCRL